MAHRPPTFVDRRDGAIAGTVAVMFAMASPAFQAISADVMLEGLAPAHGAGAVALPAAREGPDNEARGACWPSILTLLFRKSRTTGSSQSCRSFLRSSASAARVAEVGARVVTGIDFRRAILYGLRDPLLVAVCVICIAVVIIVLLEPRPFEILGLSVSLYPPRNPLNLAWALLFIRLAIAWYRHRDTFDARIGPAGRAIFYWQAVPIGVFLLLPHRLQFFLMYVSTANAFPDQHFNPWIGAQVYLYWLLDHYHVAPWSGVLALLLAAVALWRLRALTLAARAPLMLLAVSATAVILHPNANSRYLASWIFSLWVFAGAGAAILLQRMTGRLSARAGVLATGIAVLALVVVHVRAVLSLTDMVWLRHASRVPSELDLAAAYLPAIAGSRRPVSCSASGRIIWPPGPCASNAAVAPSPTCRLCPLAASTMFAVPSRSGSCARRRSALS